MDVTLTMVAEREAERRICQDNHKQGREYVDSGSLPCSTVVLYFVPSSLSPFKRRTKLTRRTLAENTTASNFVLRPWSPSQPRAVVKVHYQMMLA